MCRYRLVYFLIRVEFSCPESYKRDSYKNHRVPIIIAKLFNSIINTLYSDWYTGIYILVLIIITDSSFKLMYGQRQHIDLDSMLDKGSGLSKPRAPSINIFIKAPIRKAPVKVNGNKENMINPPNQWGTNQLKINTNF